MKTNLGIDKENEDTNYSLTFMADMFNENCVNFATTVKCPSTQELQECNIKIDDNDEKMFVFSTKRTEVFNNLSSLKNKKQLKCWCLS